MKYGHLTQAQLNQGLFDSVKAMQDIIVFLTSVANGSFVLPRDAAARSELISSHQKTFHKLQKDYDNLCEAMMKGDNPD